MDLYRKLGCATAFLVWLAVSFPFLFALAWSGAHCDPVPECQRANELYFGGILLGVVALAGMTGFGVAWSLKSVASRREDQGASAGFLTGAIVATLIAATIVIVVAYATL